MSLSRIPPQAFSCGSGTRVLKRGRTLSFILAALLLFSACAEAVASDATVTAGALVPVFAAAGGALESVSVQAGQLVHAGDPAAQVEVTRVYAPIDGTVNGLFLEPGADASAGLYLEPKETYAMTGSTAYADAAGKTRGCASAARSPCPARATPRTSARACCCRWTAQPSPSSPRRANSTSAKP